MVSRSTVFPNLITKKVKKKSGVLIAKVGNRIFPASVSHALHSES